MVEEVDEARSFAVHLLLDAGHALRVLAHLDEAAALSRGKDLVRLEPEVELLLFENLVEHADQLDGELLLAHVVIRLHDDAHQPPRDQVAVR